MNKNIELLKDRKFPCPLCGSRLDIRFDDIRQKPYVICDPCGVQMFVRRDKGIDLLKIQTDGFLDVLFGK